MNIIGVDCATKEINIGLALASFQNGKGKILEVKAGSETKPALMIVKDWLPRASLTLIAIDAPLGWPIQMGSELHSHKAGVCIDIVPDKLFSRYTDREIKRRLDKKPLEVGANLIARTAHAALQFLGKLRHDTGLAIPLAWNHSKITETSAIEVYPAATLKAMGANGGSPLSAIQKDGSLYINVDEENLNTHKKDAIVCIFAAIDFLNGKCTQIARHKKEIVEKEGWIWVRSNTQIKARK